jgi:hypothetical protein
LSLSPKRGDDFTQVICKRLPFTLLNPYQSQRFAFSLTFLGGALELYDFITFVFFTVVIGKVFSSAVCRILAGTAALCLSTVAMGGATDRFGIRRVSVPLLIALITGTYGLYVGAERLPSTLLLLYVPYGNERQSRSAPLATLREAA